MFPKTASSNAVPSVSNGNDADFRGRRRGEGEGVGEGQDLRAPRAQNSDASRDASSGRRRAKSRRGEK
jgi:hypothetical protein